MIFSQATISTDLGQKYIRHLCRHFAHKVEATFSEQEGRVQFKQGFCLMLEETGVLRVYCQALDEKSLTMIHYIFDDHIHRFARTETLDYQWQPGMPDALKDQMTFQEE